MPSDQKDVPTVSVLFQADRPGISTITLSPSETPRPDNIIGETATSEQIEQMVEVVIYDETVARGWSIDSSWGIDLDLADRSHAQSGILSAAVTPQEDYGALFFAVEENAGLSFPTSEVLGVSLWINSGKSELSPEDLSVTVIGSNDYTYWLSTDDSVEIDYLSFFSESRLHFLGITRIIPPESWVEVIVYLDKLPYEPDYRYVTGIYIKNDEGFRRTYYVDRVVLLLAQPVP